MQQEEWAIQVKQTIIEVSETWAQDSVTDTKVLSLVLSLSTIISRHGLWVVRIYYSIQLNFTGLMAVKNHGERPVNKHFR